MSSSTSDAEETMAALAQSSRGFANWLEHTRQIAARELGLHVTDFRCLALIYDSETPVSPKMIADNFGLSTGSATALADRLEKTGLIRRIPNPDDRRGVLLAPQPEMAGKTILAHRKLQDYYNTVLADFTLAELETVTRFFDRVASSEISAAGRYLRETGQFLKNDTD